MNNNLLFELGVEEIPHEILTNTIKQLKQKTIEKLNDYGIVFNKIFTYGTPRRLAFQLTDVLDKTKENKIEKKGPALKAAYDTQGKPTKALEGFLNSNKASIEDIKIKEINGNKYVVLEITEGGVEVKEILPEVIKDIIFALEFPKVMRWGKSEVSFVRPIRWIVCLWNQTIVPVKIDSLVASNVSYGHRIIDNIPFQINSILNYKNLLKEKSIIVDPDERKEIILDLVEKTSKRLKAKPLLDDELLDTLVNLTEFPDVGVGSFDQSYLMLPKEILISEMIEHQKYIPLEDSEGNLINQFLIITNVPANSTIVRGNERVIKARFNDGKFFYDEDRKKKLEEYTENLKNVMFAKNLGSVYDKVTRLIEIVKVLSNYLGYDDALDNAIRAAYLCKSDLVTSLVYEFPELQGIAGYYYALNSFENINVAIAIKEHYYPKFSGDKLPSLKESILLSLADKLDNLFALYANGNYVTGSKDPYGLRRQTLGIIRILIEKKIYLDLGKLIDEILVLYEKYLKVSKEEFLEKINEFIKTRIETVFKEYDFSFDEIEAGITSKITDIYDIYLRIKSIHEARKTENFNNLAIAFKRIKNIIKGQNITKLKEDLLKIPAEIELYKLYKENEKNFIIAFEKKDYILCVSILTSFRYVVDKFFDDVLVMDENIEFRNNRIALLSLIDNLFARYIDFEKLVLD